MYARTGSRTTSRAACRSGGPVVARTRCKRSVSASVAMPMAGRHIMSSPQLFSSIGHGGYKNQDTTQIRVSNCQFRSLS